MVFNIQLEYLATQPSHTPSCERRKVLPYKAICSRQRVAKLYFIRGQAVALLHFTSHADVVDILLGKGKRFIIVGTLMIFGIDYFIPLGMTTRSRAIAEIHRYSHV